jgi:hypothetical protein
MRAGDVVTALVRPGGAARLDDLAEGDVDVPARA